MSSFSTSKAQSSRSLVHASSTDTRVRDKAERPARNKQSSSHKHLAAIVTITPIIILYYAERKCSTKITTV